MSIHAPEETHHGESMFERLETMVEQYGEVMVEMASGQSFELHRHNTSFKTPPMIMVNAISEVHWFDADEVESYWIHYDR